MYGCEQSTQLLVGSVLYNWVWDWVNAGDHQSWAGPEVAELQKKPRQTDLFTCLQDGGMFQLE